MFIVCKKKGPVYETVSIPIKHFSDAQSFIDTKMLGYPHGNSELVTVEIEQKYIEKHIMKRNET